MDLNIQPTSHGHVGGNLEFHFSHTTHMQIKFLHLRLAFFLNEKILASVAETLLFHCVEIMNLHCMLEAGIIISGKKKRGQGNLNGLFIFRRTNWMHV